MEKIVKKFWKGHVILWKAYWLVGELLNALITVIILNITSEIKTSIKVKPLDGRLFFFNEGP